MTELRISNTAALALLFTFWSFAGHASTGQPSLAGELLECAALSDDAGRLACFDSQVAILKSTDQPEPEIERPAAAVPVAAESPPTASARQESQDDFGMNPELASRSSEPDADVEPTEIKALVTDVRRRPYGEHVVTLDNGQVWAEKRSENGLRINVGDTVTIRRGAFGSYRLIGRGKRSSQVKRIE